MVFQASSREGQSPLSPKGDTGNCPEFIRVLATPANFSLRALNGISYKLVCAEWVSEVPSKADKTQSEGAIPRSHGVSVP